jgi:hypothetical protein
MHHNPTYPAMHEQKTQARIRATLEKNITRNWRVPRFLW